MFFNFFPIEYDEPLFRPPSEANSLIFQITLGCSWNRCAFCEMYTSKKFRIINEEDILKDIQTAAKIFPDVRKIFLADGNPMVLSTEKLLFVLKNIKHYFPKFTRISTYALPHNILSKTNEELRMLKEAGLKQLYVGIESGDDEVLARVQKSETFDSTVEGLLKAKEAGMKLSVIILNGLGGKKYSEQHAVNSAKVLNVIQPEFASSLILSFPFGEKKYQDRFHGEYISMSVSELLHEMKMFIEHTELKSTIYRSNHASNYLNLEGVLSKDKNSLLEKLKFAIDNPDMAGLRNEWERGL
ncbi:MAG: radical SAM protein [Bacteroidetes bacterium RIFOXYA12_FULL_35_11]|nr:MAG: radical SAM protein [Bacteroidetes bacterium GWF2_35_48]OFY82931.1 MAG: radical SAM protein [Bacteroidetes bacterium RIFOXYA12_FULL_35_11]OFY95275.1 MAG: radical SAM protein [Bacteroidetes bacterium RIFOXYB2_FULL_35_7]OFZ01885.1 MAG: radical SAM protein [Bacteroidetes bacterium RIFOXYC12_FULL_35_7]HBX52757.1 radical SAM protein [Bacteroidales bacterium]